MPSYSDLSRIRVTPIEKLSISIDSVEHAFWHLGAGSDYSIERLTQRDRVVGYRILVTAEVLYGNLADMQPTLTAIDRGVLTGMDVTCVAQPGQTGGALLAYDFDIAAPIYRKRKAWWKIGSAKWRPSLQVGAEIVTSADLDLSTVFIQGQGW